MYIAAIFSNSASISASFASTFSFSAIASNIKEDLTNLSASALLSSLNSSKPRLIVAQLLFLESEDPDKDIHLYINSPGGSITAGMAIYDTMQYIKPDVSTICIGMAASMGAFFCIISSQSSTHSSHI